MAKQKNLENYICRIFEKFSLLAYNYTIRVENTH